MHLTVVHYLFLISVSFNLIDIWSNIESCLYESRRKIRNFKLIMFPSHILWPKVRQSFLETVYSRGFSNLYMLVVQQEPPAYTSTFVVYSGFFSLLYSLEVAVICICWWFDRNHLDIQVFSLYILVVPTFCIA